MQMHVWWIVPFKQKWWKMSSTMLVKRHACKSCEQAILLSDGLIFDFWPWKPIFIVQCWLKLTGQNALNLKFKTRFSQIGLSLGVNLWRQILLEILAELIWCNLFCEIRAQKIYPKMGHFGVS